MSLIRKACEVLIVAGANVGVFALNSGFTGSRHAFPSTHRFMESSLGLAALLTNHEPVEG